MDVKKEESFVKNFIDKTFQDRILWELKGDKREKGIARFSHTIDKIINSKYIVTQNSKLSMEECLNIIKKYSSSKTCYIMSDSFDKSFQLDGKEFELEKIIDTFFHLYFGAIMIINPHTVMLKSEQSYGPSEKYILYREKVF